MVSLQPSALPIVGIVADTKTYRHLVYLFIAVPLGFVHSMLLTIGVGIGFALLFATLIGARLLASIERYLANALLRTDLQPPDDLPESGDGVLSGARRYVDAPSTWQSLGFISMKFWVVLLTFVPIFLLANAVPLAIAPLWYPYDAQFGEVNGEPVTWAIDTLPEALSAVPLGVAGVLVALHVVNLLAYAARQMAIALLGDKRSSTT